MRTVLLFALVACGLLGAAALYLHRNAPPACDSRWAFDKVSQVLRDDYHVESIFVNNFKTVSGGYFSDGHECSAEVSAIRGNVNAGDMGWREIRYRIVRHGESLPQITVELRGQVPLAPPPPSFWTRLLAYL